jgi:hypothetical protein
MDRLDTDIWCDECGELGWEGTCPACVAFAVNHPESLADVA